MKVLISLLPVLVSAEWGEWIDGVYCGMNDPNEMISQVYSENPKYTEGYCKDFCKRTLDDMPEEWVGYGKKLCCDYEAWSDNTFNCYLYEGQASENQDYEEWPNEYFSHFKFDYWEYAELSSFYVSSSVGVLVASIIVSIY